MTRTRRLTGEQRREVILATATEVFAEDGYQRGKVADIAARMEVTQPVIFQNFGSKAALYRMVLDRASTVACDMLASVEQHNGSVSELLAMALSPSHVAAFHASGSLGALFADASGLMAEPEVGDAARDTISRIAAALTDVLAYGQRGGDIRADLDPGAAAWWVMSLLSARTFRLEVAPELVEQRLVEMTMRMISSAGEAGERLVR